ncbi:hypothetical protein C1645_826290 [Glomus cerebriforme]|uniref:Uncharacterized protein n=1 Tax=Glomus cerebriforme TaxID=658196 RepID=A0A397SQQ0_9GLOM|nr:hypothetical protein C1645_826290 [Glomus cerebriforme]
MENIVDHLTDWKKCLDDEEVSQEEYDVECERTLALWKIKSKNRKIHECLTELRILHDCELIMEKQYKKASTFIKDRTNQSFFKEGNEGNENGNKYRFLDVLELLKTLPESTGIDITPLVVVFKSVGNVFLKKLNPSIVKFAPKIPLSIYKITKTEDDKWKESQKGNDEED